MKLNRRTLFASMCVTFYGITAAAIPPTGGNHGWKYHATLHENAYYNSTNFYSKNHGKKYWWADPHLNKVSLARYNALDKPIREALKAEMAAAASEEGFSVKTNIAQTSGLLKLAFTPSNVNNVLNFTLNGFNAEFHTKIKKSWYLEGWVHGYVNNVTLQGTYDYINGYVSLNHFDLPLDVSVDLSLNIPLIGQLIDSKLDQWVNRQVDQQLADFQVEIESLFNGGGGMGATVGGISDHIPLNTLMYQGVDYGALLLNKLSRTNFINDNFSLTVGGVVAHKQYFDVTVGNVTYKRHTTGGKEPCIIGPADPDCEF